MKRFKWRLQNVLDVKTKQEQAKRVELFQLTEKLAETRTRLLTQQRVLNDIIRGIGEKEPHRRLGQQEFFLKYSGTDDDRIKKLKSQISKLESQQKEKIADLLKIRRFNEGLQRLRMQAKEQFMKEQEKLEQSDLDERATVSFVRTRNATVR